MNSHNGLHFVGRAHSTGLAFGAGIIGSRSSAFRAVDRHGIRAPLLGLSASNRDPFGEESIMASFSTEAGVGMLIVETIAKIRHAYFRHKKSIKEICRDLHVS
jgi:hypothetical protein